jgi:hypothetical protein
MLSGIGRKENLKMDEVAATEAVAGTPVVPESHAPTGVAVVAIITTAVVSLAMVGASAALVWLLLWQPHHDALTTFQALTKWGKFWVVIFCAAPTAAAFGLMSTVVRKAIRRD